MSALVKNTMLNWPVIRVIPTLFFTGGNLHQLKNRGHYIGTVAVAMLMLVILGDWLLIDGEAQFNKWSLSTFFTSFFLLAAFSYLVYYLEESHISAIVCCSLILEVWLCTNFVVYCVEYISISTGWYSIDSSVLSFCIVAWQVVAIAKILLLAFKGNLYLAKGYLFCYLAIVIFPFLFMFLVASRFWYEVDPSVEEEIGPFYYDELLYKQKSSIDTELKGVKQSDERRIELYYLGFASYAQQDVFQNEVESIEALFKENYYSAGQSQGINLINNAGEINNHPLAIKRNIKIALKGLAQKMGEEDILFLYLTSHGSKDHRLSVNLYPLKLSKVSPKDIRIALDESGIRWRVVVISACYSGGFIDDLKDEYTIVATASSEKNTSFGCKEGNEFTYFGEALFKNNISKSVRLVDAFETAIRTVKEREEKEGISSSNPQLWVGDRVKLHLNQFEDGLESERERQ